MPVKEVNRTGSVGKPKKGRTVRPAPKGRLNKQFGARASYLKLAIVFPIRPLHSEAELDEAIRVLDHLLSRKKPLDEQEQGYLESLRDRAL